MTPERVVREGIEDATGLMSAAWSPVSGGCISPAWRVTCTDGSTLFVKTRPPHAPPFMLLEEAESLRVIERTASVRVPAVRAVAQDWLALEWLEPERPSRDGWARLGRALARMHRGAAGSAARPARYGRDRDNCIGPLLQQNTPTSDWASFWVEQRLEPQLRALTLDPDLLIKFERLFGRMSDLLSGAADDGPSPVHGDLWSGNVHFTTGGAAIIDPACYYGHREVDLAMAALFGGFPAVFYEAYSEEWPLGAGHERRRPIYQLYYLLVHVRLFGDSYIRQTRAAIDAALGESELTR